MYHRSSRTILSLCLLLVLFIFFTLNVSNSLGQDVTSTPELTLLTETPIETPTDVPAPTLTETPTVVPTETATEIPTTVDAATATATDIPAASTVTTTPMPTAAAITMPTMLFNETVELDLGLWNGNGLWTRTNSESAHQGEWSFTDSVAGPYIPNTTATLGLLQPVILPINAEVYFHYWQSLDLGMGDTAQVQTSTDGLNWQTLSSDTGVRNSAWTVKTIKLSTYAGQPLWIRFVLITDNDTTTLGDGWHLDDISIQALPLPTTPLSGLTDVDTDNPALWFAEGNWQPTAGSVYSGSTAWMSIPQPETSVALTLNTDVNLSALVQPELRFWQILNLAAGNDTAQVQLSLDNGQSWLPVTSYTVGNNTADWAEQVVELSSFVGQTIRLRFMLVTDNDGSAGTGWSVDAISVQSAVAVPPTATPTITATVTATPETVSWTQYEDTDPLLVYSDGDWQTFDVAAAAGGNLTGTANTNATLTVHFEITDDLGGIHLIYSKGPEGGLFTGQVDESYIQTVDGNGATYSYGYILAFEGLSSGLHTLTITNNTGAIWVEAIGVQGYLSSQITDDTPIVIVPTPTPSAPPTVNHISRLSVPRTASAVDETDSLLSISALRRSVATAIEPSNTAALIQAISVGGAYILSGTYSINTTLIITQDTALYGDPSAVIQGNGQIPSIFVGTSAEVILQDITVMGGHATYGSGITNQGTLYIYDSTITGNGPEPDSVDGGGGIYNVGHLVIQRSTIENNGAGGGGGIQNQNGTLLAECVKFRQNRAFTGGGLLNVHGQATLLYSSFTDNMVIQRNDGVPVQGGAIYDYPDAQTIEDDPDGSLVTGEGVYLKPFAVVIGDPGGYTDDAAGGEIEYSVIGADPTIEGNPGYAEHCQRPQNQICTQRSTTEINAYIAPEHARTERFGGTPLINPRITIPANSILQLDGRYDRASSDPAHPQLEMFIYRLRGYAISGTNIDSYENNEALWINIRGNRTEYDEASVGDCTLLEFIDVASLDPRYSIIEDIRDYGIDIQPLDMTAWSIDELQAIYNGIAMTSDALRMTRIYADGSQTFPETGLNPGWYFRDVMAYLDFGLNEMDHLTQAEEEQNHPDYIVIRRSDASSLEVPCQLEPSQSLSNVDPNDTINRIQCGVDGIPDEGMSAPNSDWTPQGMLTKELVVYLLGRIFDIRSGDELTSRIKALKTTGLRDCTYITNETGGVIMGNVYDANAEVKWKWARGVRGWGSTNPALDANQNPIQLISQFQQSPIGDDESEEFYASIAGDMFLNWVFHIADTIQFPEESYNEFFTEYDACHDVQQPFNDEFEPAQAPWLGFLNMNGYGGIDTTRSGHVRFGWMVDQMDDIFEENPDWYKYVAQGI